MLKFEWYNLVKFNKSLSVLAAINNVSIMKVLKYISLNVPLDNVAIVSLHSHLGKFVHSPVDEQVGIPSGMRVNPAKQINSALPPYSTDVTFTRTAPGTSSLGFSQYILVHLGNDSTFQCPPELQTTWTEVVFKP